MTITQIRKAFAEKKDFLQKTGLEELIDYVEEQERTIEKLLKDGVTTEFTDDFLAYANGYAINSGDSELKISCCYDIRVIKGTKAAVKALAEFILNN